MNCSVPKPRLFMGYTRNPSIWALGQALLPGRGPSSQDTVLVEGVCSCHISLLSMSLHCYLRVLANSVVSAQSSWACCTSETFWLNNGHEKILLAPKYRAAGHPGGCEGTHIPILLGFSGNWALLEYLSDFILRTGMPKGWQEVVLAHYLSIILFQAGLR